MSNTSKLLLVAIVLLGAGFSIARGWGQFGGTISPGGSSFVRAVASTSPLIASSSATSSATTSPDRAVFHATPTPSIVKFESGHIQPPDVVRAIYMSQCMAGSPGLRKSLVDYVVTSELNSIVIDIKDYSGGISFPTKNAQLAPFVSDQCGAHDMKAFVESLHAKNIYVIGRITVFQDPLYVKAHPEVAVKTKSGGIWKNYGGLPFVDVGATQFWDYIIELSKVSYGEMGFDELNFDYIRFPSDGPLSDANYSWSEGKSKTAVVESFFKYLHEHLGPLGIPTSADMFGMVSSHTDDLGIGQVLESAFPYFDYIYPMVYPSHYPKGFNGYANVNDHVYDIVYSEMKHAVARAKTAGYPASKIRPWLQSFDYPVTYTPAMVEEQIKANHDAGLDSYLFWDAANKYISLRKVLLTQE